MTIIAMAFLTFLGASAGSPTEIDLEVAPQFEAGKQVAAQSGCLACHKFGDNGNDGPGPELTEIGSKLPAEAIKRTLINPSGSCGAPSAGDLPPEKFDSLVEVPRLTAVSAAGVPRLRGRAEQEVEFAGQVGGCSTGSPASTT